MKEILRTAWLAGLLAAFPAALVSTGVRADTLEIQVVDGTSGTPLSGAFVQVGDAPDSPFPGNWGWTGGDGRISFSDPGMTGPQTVTAGIEEYAFLTVIESAEGTLVMPLHPAATPSGVTGPRAEIYGTTTGIQTQSNDGNIDLGFAYPAVRLSDLLSSRSLPFEVPADTVNFPLIGDVVLPGNVAIPSQTEFFIYNFSKPNYHFFVPDGTTYDFIVLGGRIPIESLAGGGDPINDLVMREIGAERSIPVSGDTQVILNSDLNLSQSLGVDMSEAPTGSEIFAACVADVAVGGETRTLFFDAKSKRRDTASQLLLSGMNPSGDLGDAVPYLAGYYSDTTAAAWEAGRVDRSPLTIPANRTLGDFFLLPDLTQAGEEFLWSDVGRPGVTPDPTWAVARLRLDSVVPGDSSVTPRTAWEIWTPAAALGFQLPALAASAPGGLPDPGQTPENDRLLWEQWVADPSGGISDVLGDAFTSLTHWSRRTVEITPPVVVVHEIGLGTLGRSELAFRLAPNPGREVRDIVWSRAPRPGDAVVWTVWDPSGRKVAGGSFAAHGTLVDRGALSGVDSLPTGVYWVRLESGDRAGTRPLVVLR